MNFFFDIVMLLVLAILQLSSGSILAVDLPLIAWGLLVFSMRRGVLAAVFTAFAVGFAIDLICGREFPSAAISLPVAIAVGAGMLPDRPLRFIYSDYVFPGAVTVFTLKLMQMITPLLFGNAWYYLVQDSIDLIPVTVVSAFLLPFWIFFSDRLAGKLGIRRIFIRTMFVALNPARR